MQVLLTACLLLMPTMAPRVLGVLLVLVGALRLLGLYTVFVRYREAQRTHGDIELSDWVLSIVLPLLCHVSLMAVGAGFVAGQTAAITGLAVVSVILLFIGIHGAWELLVWMALAVSERRRGPPGPPPA